MIRLIIDKDSESSFSHDHVNIIDYFSEVSIIIAYLISSLCEDDYSDELIKENIDKFFRILGCEKVKDDSKDLLLEMVKVIIQGE